jgi:magnesium transporter
MGNKYLLNLFTLEKSLVYYLNAVHSNAALINRLKSSTPKIPFTQENIEFLDDMSIENDQCLNQINIFSQVLASLMDARAIMLPTLIVSIFSMNVDIPLEHHPYAFWIIFIMAISPALLIGLLWWRKKW